MHGPRAMAVLTTVFMLAGCASTPSTVAAPLSTPQPNPSASLVASAPATGPGPAATRAVTATTAESPAAQVIPWIDAPVAKPKDLPDPNAQITHRVLYRRCTAADLIGAFGRGGAGMGSASEVVSFTNRSRTPCSLDQGPIAISNVEADGLAHSLTLGAPGFGHGLDAVANLSPGQNAQTELWESDSCAAFQHPLPIVRVDFRLPDQSVVQVPADPAKFQAPVDCRLLASWFGTPHHEVPEPAYPTDPLVVTTTLPSRVRAGRVVDYTVTLTNPTGHAVSLTPCPSYEEAAISFAVQAKSDVVHVFYRLNCAGHRDVGAHSALTFAMQITAPRVAGGGKFFWGLLPAGGGAGRGGELIVG